MRGECHNHLRGTQLIAALRAAPIFLAILLLVPAHAATQAKPPLVLERTIPLPDVGGRIDHMAIDRGRQRLIVAALGNDTVEVIDLRGGKPLDPIRGLKEPQGVGYTEKADLLFVANAGDGSVRMFQAADFTSVGRIDLRDDADNIRIDTRRGTVIVGYGRGGLAIIDPMTRKVTGMVSLPAHPEGFRIEADTGRAFVNVPGGGQIAVVDLERRRQIATWRVPRAGGNFPMALDADRGVLAVVFRRPSRFVVLEAKSGSVISNLPTCSDADDIFFDARRSRVYISCGAGEIAVFQRDGRTYRPLPSVPTTPGARTSLFVPELDRLFLAVRAGLSGHGASIQIFRPSP
jgi:hypothetical protein